MAQEKKHPFPLSQRIPFQSGADFQYAYMDYCTCSMQDMYITKTRILGCVDCEAEVVREQNRAEMRAARK